MKTSWLNMASESMEAAVMLKHDCPRWCASRAYYAAYSATHAMLLHSNLSTPELGNWQHAGLGQAVCESLKRGRGRRSKHAANALKNAIESCYSARIAADYKPEYSVDDTMASKAIKRARHVLHAAKELLQ
jgi:uncharacterized protein (UPF0332 family)